jgi:hypothetical protein
MSASPGLPGSRRTIALPLDDGTIRLLSTESEAAVPDPAVLWDDLASPDAADAGAAVRALAERPDARRWIRDHPVPVPALGRF